jgi:DGQHR domain-containing protein
MIATAFPYSLAKNQILPRPAKKMGSPRTDINRPIMLDHAKRIQEYLEENPDNYILPPVTLNVKQMPQVHVAKTNSAVRSGYLVVNDDTTFYVTDGQHRIAAIAGYSSGKEQIPGLLASDPEKGRDGLAVMIIVEPEINQIHQDFADAAQTKPIPASLLAVYNIREPVNKVLASIVADSKIFKGRLDETSRTLSKKSPAMFLLNQIRQFVKELLMGDYAASDEQLAQRASRYLDTKEKQDAFISNALQLLDVLTENMVPWNMIAGLSSNAMADDKIVDLRVKYLNLTATGLVIIGRIGYEVTNTIPIEQSDRRREIYISLARDIDWQRTADIWKGNVVESGRVVTNRGPVKSAVEAVRSKLELV